jgi:hypothetical protein
LLGRLQTSFAAHPSLEFVEEKYHFSADGHFICNTLAWRCPANCNADGCDPTGDSVLDGLQNTFVLEKPSCAKYKAAIGQYDTRVAELGKVASAAKKAGPPEARAPARSARGGRSTAGARTSFPVLPELKKVLIARGLPAIGLKAKLEKRLQDAINSSSQVRKMPSWPRSWANFSPF